MNFKKILLKVFSANFFQLISAILVGFFVPAILDISEYANLKTYSLLVSYIGLLHFGFIDGLYLKYGGNKLEDVNKDVLLGEHIFLLIFELFISIIFVIFSVITKNVILLIFSFSILPYMSSSYFKHIYQATGEFSKFSKIMYIYTISYLALNLFLVFVLRITNYVFYCLLSIISNLLSVLVFECKFLRDIKYKPKIELSNIKDIFKSGFILMLGNLAVVLILGIDRWFVKIFLSVEDFAYYSFAVSMFNIITTLVSSIAIIFYNYLFNNLDFKKLNYIKNILMILGSFASSAFFLLCFIVNIFLSNYINSLEIIAVTFSIFPYMIVINVIINNLYKVMKVERKYLKTVLIVLTISIILNMIFLIISKSVISIAIATFFTMLIWLVYSINDLKVIKLYIRDILYLVLVSSGFFIISSFISSLIGFVIYILYITVISVICYRDSLLFFVRGRKGGK